MILGIDQPIKVLIITPYIGIQYSEGIGGGTALNIALKLPNCVIFKVAALSLEPKPKVFKM